MTLVRETAWPCWLCIYVLAMCFQGGYAACAPGTRLVFEQSCLETRRWEQPNVTVGVGRSDVAAVCFPEVLLFLGGDAGPRTLSEIVVLDTLTGNTLPSSTFPSRYGMSIANTSEGWVLYGGMTSSVQPQNDLFLLTLCSRKPLPNLTLVSSNENLVSGPQCFRLFKLANSSQSPFRRQETSLVEYNKSLYLFGGVTDNRFLNDLVYSSCVWGSSWQPIVSQGTVEERKGHAMYVIDHALIVFGGLNSQGTFLEMPSAYYSFYEDAWKSIDTPGGPGPRAYFSSTRISGSMTERHWVFFFGGLSASGLQNDLFVYDLQFKRWLHLDPLVSRGVNTLRPPPRTQAGLCAVSSAPDLSDLTLTLVGGATSFNKMNDLWVFVFGMCGGTQTLQCHPGQVSNFTDGSDGLHANQTTSFRSFEHPGGQLCSWYVTQSDPLKHIFLYTDFIFISQGDSLRIDEVLCEDPEDILSTKEFSVPGSSVQLCAGCCAFVYFQTASNKSSSSFFSMQYSEVSEPSSTWSWKEWTGLAGGILVVLCFALLLHRYRKLRTRPAIVLSSSQQNMDFAARIERCLSKAGFRVSYERSGGRGSSWKGFIDEAFAVVFIMSRTSVSSRRCKEEIYYAKKKEKLIFPLMYEELNETELRGGLRLVLAKIQWIDFTKHENERTFREKIELLKQLLQTKSQLRQESLLGERYPEESQTSNTNFLTTVGQRLQATLGRSPDAHSRPEEKYVPRESVTEHAVHDQSDTSSQVYICYEPVHRGLQMALLVKRRLQAHGVICVLASRTLVIEAYRAHQKSKGPTRLEITEDANYSPTPLQREQMATKNRRINEIMASVDLSDDADIEHLSLFSLPDSKQRDARFSAPRRRDSGTVSKQDEHKEVYLHINRGAGSGNAGHRISGVGRRSSCSSCCSSSGDSSDSSSGSCSSGGSSGSSGSCWSSCGTSGGSSSSSSGSSSGNSSSSSSSSGNSSSSSSSSSGNSSSSSSGSSSSSSGGSSSSSSSSRRRSTSSKSSGGKSGGGSAAAIGSDGKNISPNSRSRETPLFGSVSSGQRRVGKGSSIALDSNISNKVTGNSGGDREYNDVNGFLLSSNGSGGSSGVPRSSSDGNSSGSGSSSSSSSSGSHCGSSKRNSRSSSSRRNSRGSGGSSSDLIIAGSSSGGIGGGIGPYDDGPKRASASCRHNDGEGNFKRGPTHRRGRSAGKAAVGLLSAPNDPKVDLNQGRAFRQATRSPFRESKSESKERGSMEAEKKGFFLSRKLPDPKKRRVLEGDTFEHNSSLIDKCLMVVFIMSQTSLQSIDCADEVHYAYESRKKFLKIVYQKKPLDLQGSMAMMLQSCDCVNFCHVDPADLPDTDSHWMRLYAGVFQGLTQRIAEPPQGEAKLPLHLGASLQMNHESFLQSSDSEDDEHMLVAEMNERTKALPQVHPPRSLATLLSTKARTKKKVAFEEEPIPLVITIQPPARQSSSSLTPPSSSILAAISRLTPSVPAPENPTFGCLASLPSSSCSSATTTTAFPAFSSSSPDSSSSASSSDFVISKEKEFDVIDPAYILLSPTFSLEDPSDPISFPIDTSASAPSSPPTLKPPSPSSLPLPDPLELEELLSTRPRKT